ncbi:hypothetical protein [Paraburkholderia caribensis]|uniref:hypothetical protein n=1 Tax=Paraburkholderia caribensis TaxID=75105 RepID=UPI0034D24626
MSDTQAVDVEKINEALSYINHAIGAAKALMKAQTDPNLMYELTILGAHLIDVQGALTRAVNAANNAAFQNAIAQLNQTADTLKNQAGQIKQAAQIIGQVGQVIGWITQALAIIAVL